MTKRHKKTNSSRIVTIFIAVFLVFTVVMALLIGISVARYFTSPALESSDKDIADIAQDIEVYPGSYVSANLPQYPSAKLTNLSKKGSTVQDGVSLLLYSNDTTNDVAKYYDDRLKSLGWSTSGYVSSYSDKPYAQEYRKGNESFMVLVNPSETSEYKTAVSITWSVF